MTLHDYLQWWNVVYLAPLAISLIWILASAMGGMHIGAPHTGGGHGASHGLGHDLGHGFGHHHGIGHSHSANGNAHGHSGNESGFSQKILNILGIGQVPITLLLGIFMFCWGACGMAMNQFFSGIGKYPLVYIWPSMGITFLISFALTRAMAAIVARTLPAEETFGVSRRELVGSTGKAVFTISAKGGTVDICDKYGTLHREQAKTGDEESTVLSGTEVLILDYDVLDHKFIVKGGGL